MKIIEANAYNKTAAFEATQLDADFEKMKNATQKWKREGSPIRDKDLKKFAEAYLKDNKLMAAYIVVESSSDDTRMRPYNIINQVTDGKRKSRTAYQIKQGEFKVKYSKSVDAEGKEKEVATVTVEALGAVEKSVDKKDTAVKLMKELITENKKNYVVEIVKEITEGQRFAAYGEYTPSKSAHLGKFVFFAAE